MEIRIKGILCVAALGLLLAGPAIASELATAPSHQQAEQMIENMVARIVLNDVGRLFGEEAGVGCLETAKVSLCLDPATPKDVYDELLRSLPTWEGDDRYQRLYRWTVTATDGYTGIIGDPVTITYSFIPDGTWIPPGAGEPGSASSLYAEMNGHFGSEAVWKPMFASHLALWGNHIGITYVEVSDDGANFPNSTGILGSRGDVRIGAHNIDGGSNILAYNYFPNTGDMVLDTSENWGNPSNDYIFFTNIVAHEHGHGHGLGHVLPTSCTKLMEPNYCNNFRGPQDDDIRGGMRNYGDFLEENNSGAEATDLGVLNGEYDIETVSLTYSADHDWFHFSVGGDTPLDVTMHPVGSAYQVDGVVVFTNKIMDLAFELRTGVDGGTLLIEVNDEIEGVDEVLVDYPLTAGDYWIHVKRAAGASDVQRYNLHLNVDETAVPDGEMAIAGLNLRNYPNPFNPKTTARFYAPAAGHVSLDVYNVAGGLVRSFETEAATAGWMEIVWNGKDDHGQAVPSGIYFMQAQASGEKETVRAVLLK